MRPAEAELDKAQNLGITLLFTIEPGYPMPLAAVSHPPPLLYIKGNVDVLARKALAIVGARKCSAAGAALTRQIATDLGAAGLTIVSGLARGIDGAAHEAALATGTIAVLAGGLDTVYPPEHRDLQDRIARVGCLVSEQPPGFIPRGRDFPRRNRIVSGISYGVVVIEAARRSGSLTTARMAAEQGRDVYAVPGHPLDPRAEGTNSLLKSGARLITSADDILHDLAQTLSDAPAIPSASDIASHPRSNQTAGHASRPQAAAMPPPIPATGKDQRTVLDALGAAPVTIDAVCRATGLPVSIVRMALLELSLAGRVEHHGHNLVSQRIA